MFNTELLLTPPPYTSSILLPFISGSAVDAYCYISFTNNSSEIALYITLQFTLQSGNLPLIINPGTYESSLKTAVPNTDAIRIANLSLDLNISNDVYISGVLEMQATDIQHKITLIPPSEGGYLWDIIFLPQEKDPWIDYYLIGIVSGSYQPIEGLVPMFITIE